MVKPHLRAGGDPRKIAVAGSQSLVRALVLLLAMSLLAMGCARRYSETPQESLAPPAPSQLIPKAQEPPPPPLPRELLRNSPLVFGEQPLMKGIAHLTERMKVSRYTHGFEVNVRQGIYNFDCSGMVDWVLSDTAPRAHRSLHQGLASRPLARDFVEYLARIDQGKSRGGWVRIYRVADARPGDVVAWKRPRIVKSQNTGHVGIIVLTPLARSKNDSAYLVRIADSSRLMHGDDSRGGRDGFGYGTILLETDPATGAPSGFSFAGEDATRVFGTQIVIGRPTG